MKLAALLEAIDKQLMFKYQQEAVEGLDDPAWDVSIAKVSKATLGFLTARDQRGIKSNFALTLSKEGCTDINLILPKTEGGVIVVVRKLYNGEKYVAWYSNNPFPEQMQSINFIAKVLSLQAALLALDATYKVDIDGYHKLGSTVAGFTLLQADEILASVTLRKETLEYAVTAMGHVETRVSTEAEAIAKVKELIANSAKYRTEEH